MSLDPRITRKLRHVLRVNYPVHVWPQNDGFVACHPDLPGCKVSGKSPAEVYAKLDRCRRDWLTQQVVCEQTPPRPHSHDDKPRTEAPTLRPGEQPALRE